MAYIKINSSIAKLEFLTAEKILAERRRRSLFGDDSPLSKRIMTEVFLTSSGFMHPHGVLTRKSGIIGIELEQAKLAESIATIGNVANGGVWPTLQEIRAILHPPFESFRASKKHVVSVDIGEAVTQIYVDPSDIFRPEGQDAQIIQFPATVAPTIEVETEATA